MQRRFVVCLLGQSSFSKHLTAVREANTLFKRSTELRSVDSGASVKVHLPRAVVKQPRALPCCQTRGLPSLSQEREEGLREAAVLLGWVQQRALQQADGMHAEVICAAIRGASSKPGLQTG